MGPTTTTTKRPPRASLERLELTRLNAIGLLVAFALFWVPLLVDVPDLDDVGERMLSIFLVALVLFVTEAIPLFATAALSLQLLRARDAVLAEAGRADQQAARANAVNRFLVDDLLASLGF